MLVGANGSIDIIEIKKPFRSGLVSKGGYCDNHDPVRGAVRDRSCKRKITSSA